MTIYYNKQLDNRIIKSIKIYQNSNNQIKFIIVNLIAIKALTNSQ